MAFKDGGGSVAWTGFRWTGDGVADQVNIIPVSPLAGNRIPSTAIPLSANVSNTAAGGSDLQFQVATDAGFTAIISSPSPTGVANGLTTVTATALPTGVPLYWRVRGAPAGTTGWGPWSATNQFVADVNAGKAFGFVTSNVGIANLTSPSRYEATYENVGIDPIEYPGAREASYENVGIERDSQSHEYQYVYEGDVSTNVPTPHVWFLWKPFGFVGDEVWAYGHGFGNPQSEYSAHLRLRLGPDYDPADDIEPTVDEWYLQEAIAGAYTEDRIIYAGTSVAPPVVNQQVEIVRWIVPSGALPTEPTTHEVYVTHSSKMSNLAPWLMYPTIPVAAGVVERNVTSSTYVRLAATLSAEGAIPQHLMAYDVVPYMISNGRAERMPLLSASAVSGATLGTWDHSDALEDALDVSLGSTRRWVPDATKVVAHPELGTGVKLWEPSVGSSAMSWRFDADSEPYIDPAYEIDTRQGTKVLPAMIFPGDAWAKLTANLPAGPNFTMAVTAVLQAPPDGRGHILSTFTNGTPDVGSTAASLQLEGSALNLYVGGRLASESLQRLSRRPVVIVLSVAGRSSYLSVLDINPSAHRIATPPLSAANASLWMGRSDQLGAQLYPAAMDVLDVAYWSYALDPAAVRNVLNKMDGIYGVTGNER